MVGQDDDSSGQAESSSNSRVRLLCFRRKVEVIQKYVKKHVFKKLMFLTISQPIPEPSRSNSDNSSGSGRTGSIFTGHSSATPRVEPKIDDGSDQTESIFTEDLQINWSAVTAKQLKRISKELRR